MKTPSTFYELVRGGTSVRELNEALDALGVEHAQRFKIARSDVKPGCCTFCGQRINVSVDCRLETGWTKARSTGGTNALKLREVHPDTWAHERCIEQIKRGISPEQQTL